MTVDEFLNYVPVLGWHRGPKTKAMMANYAYDVYRIIHERRSLWEAAVMSKVIRRFAHHALTRACEEVDKGIEGVVVPELEAQRQADKRYEEVLEEINERKNETARKSNKIAPDNIT